MKKRTYILGILAASMVTMYACNHPRTEDEQPREPEDRELTPHEGPVSTTDSLHNDSIMRHDSTRIHNDPQTPNF